MKRTVGIAAGVLFFGFASSAQATLLTYDFTGVLENVQISRPGGAAYSGFGLSQGDTAAGHITFDLSGPAGPRDEERQCTLYAAVKDFSLHVGALDIDVRDIQKGLRPIELANDVDGRDSVRYGEYYATSDYRHPAQSGVLDVLLLEFLGDAGTISDESIDSLGQLDRFGSTKFLFANEASVDQVDPTGKNLFVASGKFTGFSRRPGDDGPDEAPVPEPATLFLSAAGLAGLALARRAKGLKRAAP